MLPIGVIILAFCAGLTGIAVANPSHATASPTPILALRDHPGAPAPSSAEAASINAIVAAFDNALSVSAGGHLDRVHLDRLFLPGGRIVIEVDPKPHQPADAVLLTPDEYARLSDEQTAHAGFYDRVVINRVEQFGNMAHVYSVFESLHAPSDPRAFARGIKSFELLHSDGRWRIVEVFYEHEQPSVPIPPEWIPAPGD